MTTAQKVIKYVAIAFAIFLVVGIIDTIISIGSGITSFFDNTKLAKTETTELKEDSKTLNIELAASSLEIKKGEKIKIEVTGDDITVEEKDNKINIEEKIQKWSFNRKASAVVLYLPDEYAFEEAVIKTGAGKLNVQNIKATKLSLSLGAGKATIDNVVSEKTKIETGAGELVIKKGKLGDSKIEVGVGKLSITAEFIENAEIETGIGSNNIKLLPTENDYKIEFKKGIGNINYNGKSVANDSTIGEGSNFIKIEGGIGSINVEK